MLGLPILMTPAAPAARDGIYPVISPVDRFTVLPFCFGIPVLDWLHYTYYVWVLFVPSTTGCQNPNTQDMTKLYDFLGFKNLTHIHLPFIVGQLDWVPHYLSVLPMHVEANLNCSSMVNCSLNLKPLITQYITHFNPNCPSLDHGQS